MTTSEFEYAPREKLLRDFCDEQGPHTYIGDELRWSYKVDPEKQPVRNNL